MSYARTDQRFVDRLMGDLEADGFGVWRDVDKLGGGDTWREAISEAIRGCDAVVIVLSPDSAASRNVSKELSVAEERSKRIVPVLHRPARLEGAMELLLTDLQYVDFTRDFDAGLRSLLTTLRRAPLGTGAPRAAPIAGPRATWRWRRAAIALVAAVALIGGATALVALTRSTGDGRSSTTTSAATTSPPTSPAQPASSPTTPGPSVLTGPFRLLDASEMTVHASSELAAEPGCGGTCTFGPANLIDGTLTTAWSEGQAGDGAGAWIVLAFDRPFRLVEVGMWPGWQRGEPCVFERNARPQDVLISFDDGRRSWLVPNEPGGATTALDVVTSSLRFDVRAVYPGSDCGGRQPDADMLISEIEVRVAPA